MFRNKPKRVIAKDITTGQFLIINEQKYRINAVASNNDEKFIFAQLADGTSDRVLRITLKLDTEMYVFTK